MPNDDAGPTISTGCLHSITGRVVPQFVVIRSEPKIQSDKPSTGTIVPDVIAHVFWANNEDSYRASKARRYIECL